MSVLKREPLPLIGLPWALVAVLLRLIFDGDALRLRWRWGDFVATFEGDSPETVRANRISLRAFFSEGTNAL